MKTLNEVLNKIKEEEMELLYNEEYLTGLILDDIDKWFEEETDKQDYFEENFRNK